MKIVSISTFKKLEDNEVFFAKSKRTLRIKALKEAFDRIKLGCIKKTINSFIRECLKFHSSENILTSNDDWKRWLVTKAVGKYRA